MGPIISIPFSLEITKERSTRKVQITFSLFDLKYSCEQARQESIYKYLLTCLFRLYSTKTENLPTRFISDVDHFAEKHVHPVPIEVLYQHGNSVQIMVHRHGRFPKRLDHVAMNFNVLYFCDMQATCVM